jgi:hypothetical protein
MEPRSILPLPGARNDVPHLPGRGMSLQGYRSDFGILHTAPASQLRCLYESSQPIPPRFAMRVKNVGHLATESPHGEP